MKRFFTYRKTILVICSIIACITLFTRCIHDKKEEKTVLRHFNGEQYAGSEACRNCHRAICDSFPATAHHLTSIVAEKKYIKGSFLPDRNSFVYDGHRKVVMEEREDGLFQVAYTDGKEEKAGRFDIVMGSGKKGQTYIYRKDKELFQLPVSYFTSAHSWANSPGFTPDRVSFDRNIEVRCLECHTSFARQLTATEYAPGQVLYGVECERCHGPGQKHVEFQAKNPAVRQAKFIVNPATLDRQRNLDVCALCHSGVMSSRMPAFSFLPGDDLSKFFVRNSSRIDSSNLDVHANQYGLLTSSKCFRVSGTMTCSTCHNTHVKEDGDLAVYDSKCMKCHVDINHTGCTRKVMAEGAAASCVSCHMPVKPSHNLTLLPSGRTAASPELVRSHRIAVY